MLIVFSSSAQNSIFWLNKPLINNQVNWVGMTGDYYDLTSTDGKNWVKGTVYYPQFSLTVIGIDWNGDRWIRALRSGNSFAYPQYSFDGISWVGINIPYMNWTSVKWDNYNKLWILVGSNYITNEIKIFTSVDGINWLNFLSNVQLGLTTTGSRYLCHNSGGNVLSSNDLVNWHSYPALGLYPGIYQDLRILNIYWDGRKVIASGDYYSSDASARRGVIMTSVDGITYKVVVNGRDTQNPVSIFDNIFEYKGDIYVRGTITTDPNFNSIFYKSTDLVTWNPNVYGFTGESKGSELVFTDYNGSSSSQIKHTITNLSNPDYSALDKGFTAMKSRFVKDYLKMNVTCPIVRTTINEISNNYIKVRVYFDSDGGTDIIQKGICWSTSPNPTLADQHTEDGAFADSYITTAINLLPDTRYYIRSYAINSVCTVYSSDESGGVTYPSLLPTVATRYVTYVGSTSASFEGSVIADGGATVTDRGFCWSTSPNPTISSNHVSAGSGLGIFNSGASGLSQNTTYYVRAYALNSSGYAYGSQLTFTTGGSIYEIPILQGINISNITLSTADAQSTIISDGGDMLIGLGFCYSTTNPNPTTSDTTIGGVSLGGDLTATLTGLSPMTRYYIRAYATNSVGTGYSSVTSFETNTNILATLSSSLFGETTTDMDVRWTITLSNPAVGYVIFPLVITNSNNTGTTTVGVIFNSGQQTSSVVSTYSKAMSQYTAYCNFDALPSGYYGSNTASYVISTLPTALPTVTTTAISNIATNSASGGGNVTFDGGSTVTARGICWSTNPNPTTSDSKTTDGSGVGGFTSNITGLICGTNYFVRAYATSSSGTAYGNTVNFSTDVCTYVPTVSLNAINKYGDTYATFSGAVTGDGNSTVTERGFVYSTSPSPTTSNNKITLGNGIGLYSTNIYGLSQNTRYYVRAYAINSVGTAYSNEVDFTTLNTTVVVNISTAIPSNITVSSATLGGNISSDGGNTITDRGVVYGLSINPTISDTKVQSGSGTGAYSLNVTGLTQGTTYHVRAYAINSSGTFYGADENFITLTDGATACGAGQTFPGGTSYPSTNSVVLGSGTGIVTLTFDALGIPDFFSVEYNSTIYNSGWRGDPIYDYGGSLRDSFRSSLIGKVDPSQNTPFPPTFPNTALYPEDGYPRINSVTGQIVFSKTTNNPTSATVKVYAPMSGTKWSYVLSCPN